MTADGNVGAVLSVSDSARNGRPRVAWNGSTYLVVWEHTYASGDIDVFGRKVSKAGALAPSQFGVAVLNTLEREPAIVAAGATFYVAWTDDRNGGDDIYGSRISTAGNGSAVDSPGVRISNGVKPETKPELAWNGTRYLVTYELAYSATDPDVLTQVVSASNVPSPTVVPLAASGLPEEDPVVASNGSGFLVTWADGAQGTSDIKGYRLSSTGALAGPVIVSAATGGQTEPSVAFNGTYLVAWTDERDDPEHACLRRAPRRQRQQEGRRRRPPHRRGGRSLQPRRHRRSGEQLGDGVQPWLDCRHHDRSAHGGPQVASHLEPCSATGCP